MEFDNWWATKRATFGGDDGVEFIEAEVVRNIVAEGGDMIVRFRGDEMSVICLMPKAVQ